MQEALLAAALQWPREGVPEQPARLADPGRRAADDRSHAQRDGAPPARDARSASRGARASSRRCRAPDSGDGEEQRRHAGAALHVLPSGADAAVGHRADAARGRRPDDRGDRQRVPGARGDDGAADQPGEADASRRRACRSSMPTDARARRAARRRAARALSDLQRGLRDQQRRRRCSARDLADEAIRLARARAPRCCPDDGEVAGLLALMLLTDARRARAHGPDGELIPLDEQDRDAVGPRRRSPKASRSSRARCRGAPSGPTSCRRRSPRVHDEAARAEDTDWPQILALYGLLERMSDNPMVRLNHAIAAAMVQGPQAGLELLDGSADGRAPGRQPPAGRRARAPAGEGRRRGRAVEHYLAAAEARPACPSATTCARRRRGSWTNDRMARPHRRAEVDSNVPSGDRCQPETDSRQPEEDPGQSEAIEANQKKLDTVLANQKAILAKLK